MRGKDFHRLSSQLLHLQHDLDVFWENSPVEFVSTKRSANKESPRHSQHLPDDLHPHEVCKETLLEVSLYNAVMDAFIKGETVGRMTYPCRQRWLVKLNHRCTGCMTWEENPCSSGDLAEEPPGAPGWPVEAKKKKKKVIYDQISMSPPAGSTYSLDALLVDADAPEQSFKDFTESESKEADRAELQAVSHLLQDGRCLRLDLICWRARFFGNLKQKKASH